MEFQLKQQFSHIDQEISSLYYFLNRLEEQLFLEDEQKFYLKNIVPSRKKYESENDYLIRIIDFRQEELKSIWKKINTNLEYLEVFQFNSGFKRCIILEGRENLEL